MPGRSKSDIKEPTQLKQKDLNKITKPLWIKLYRSNFGSLIKVVVNNLDNKDYQTKTNNDNYDFKNAEKCVKMWKKLVKMKHTNCTKIRKSK